MSTINKNDCHYYQFTCSGREGPQLQVTEGSIRYRVKEGAADQPGVSIVSNATVSASINPVLISTGVHDDTRQYTLFISGSSLSSTYRVSPLNASVLSVYQKEQQGLPTHDVGGCQHQNW